MFRISTVCATPSFAFVHKPPAIYQLRTVNGKRVSEGSSPYPIFTRHGDKYANEYITVFGPSFLIPGTFFPGKGPEEHVAGISRLIGLRKAEKPGYCQRLTDNNNAIGRTLRGHFHRYHKFFYAQLEQVAYDVAYDLWLNQPHSKRKLRQSCHKNNELYLGELDSLKKPINGKLKPGEIIASAGKARMIADLGVGNTQVTACQIGYIKTAMEVPYHLGPHEVRYVGSPDHDVLTDVFKWLIHPNASGGLRMCYFSDDCSFSATCSDGVLMANGDISQCDGSHRSGLFRLVKQFLQYDPRGTKTEGYDSYERAFSLLSNKFVVRNAHDLSEKYVYEFNEPKLYSGSTLTTVMNNFATLAMFMSFTRLVPDTTKVTKKECAAAYIRAAEAVGYIVKCSVCTFPEELQFLKHFPCRGSDGEFHAIMSLGTYMKGFGRVYGDLPSTFGTSKIPLVDRFINFNREVVIGRRNWGNHEVNRAFELGCSLTEHTEPSAIRVGQIDKSIGGFRSVEFSLAQLATRYRCSTDELAELVSCIRSAGVGSVVKLPIVKKIYDLDYG